MCYDDASGPTVMTTVCPPEHEALLPLAGAATITYRSSFPGSDTYGIAGSPQVTVTVRRGSPPTPPANAWPAAPGRAWPRPP
jgi:hypothetical protein